MHSGWAFRYGPGIHGGVTIPEWASADGVNWERVAYDGGWNTIDRLANSGVGFFAGYAGNVAIAGAHPTFDDPSDSPAPSWFWVTQLP